MKTYFTKILALLCLMVLGGVNLAWGASISDVTVIGGDYLMIADNYNSNGTVDIAANTLFADNHFIANNTLSKAINKGTNVINGEQHYNSARVKDNIWIAFKVSGPCKVKVYHQSHSSRTICINHEYVHEGYDVKGAFSTTSTEATISEAQTVYVYSYDGDGKSGGGDLYIAGIEVTFDTTTAPEITTDVNTNYTTDTRTVADISVIATGATSYQWYTCDNTSKANPVAIEGATSATLNHVFTEAGTYYVYCVLTNKNGSTESSVAVVEVTGAAKSNECELTNIVLSNGFDMFIKDDVLTGYYLVGTDVPTVKSITISEFATYAINGNTLTVTAEDGVTTKEFEYNVSAVEPLTDNDVHTMTSETPSWLKGGQWNTGKVAHEIYKSVEYRITQGLNRVYLFVGKGSAIRLSSVGNTNYGSSRSVKVSRNGVQLSVPTAMSNDAPIDIVADENAPCMIEIVNTSTGGSAGIVTAQLINYPVVSYACNDADVEGVVPVSEKVSAETIILPKYYRLHKDGYTLTAWSDGENEYAPGANYTINGDVTFEPVFTKNTKVIGSEETSVTFDLRANNGAPKFTTEGKSSLLTTQTTNGIDVKMNIDATSGKFSIVDRGDYCQINPNTVIKVPAVKGMTVTIDAWYDTYDFIINGETVDQDKKQTIYTYNGDDAELSITFGTSAYYNYIKFDYPAVTQSATISAGGYTTFCPIYSDVTIPEDVTAYTAKINEAKDAVVLTKVEGGKLPQGCGVVLAGANSTEYTFAPTTDATELTDNQMVGATTDVEIENVYVLGVNNGTCVFGKWDGTNGLFPAGKAYLDVDATSTLAKTLRVVFDGDNETTGINNAATEKAQDGAIFNLAGQKVSANYKGIVIINGKKALVK